MQNICIVERKDTTEAADSGARYRYVLLAIALAAVMLASASAMVFADEAYADGPDDSGDDGNIHWEIAGDTITISKIDGAESGAMNDYPFGGAKPPWCDSSCWSGVKKVVINEGVTYVGSFAFYFIYGFAEIGAVSLPSTLEKIGASAFSSNIFLTEVNIPASVKRIDDSGFASCGITTLILNEGLTSVGENCFLGARMTTLTLPSTLESFGYTAFITCESLEELTVNGPTLGERTFAGPYALKKLVVSDNLQTKDPKTFEGITFVIDGNEYDDVSAEQLKGTTWTGNGDGKLYLQNSSGDQSKDNTVHYFAIGIIMIIVLIIAALIVMKRRQNSQ